MNDAVLISVATVAGAILTKFVDYLTTRRNTSKQSETEDKKMDLDWQKEFNAATAAFRVELQDTIKELRQEVSDLRDDVDKFRTDKMNLEEEVTRLRGKNDSQNEEIARLIKQNVSLKNENDKLELRVQELERKNGGETNVGN
jgi:chromosome segregation ATPase